MGQFDIHSPWGQLESVRIEASLKDSVQDWDYVGDMICPLDTSVSVLFKRHKQMLQASGLQRSSVPVDIVESGQEQHTVEVGQVLRVTRDDCKNLVRMLEPVHI